MDAQPDPTAERETLLARSHAMVQRSRRMIAQSRDLIAVSPVRGQLRRHAMPPAASRAAAAARPLTG